MRHPDADRYADLDAHRTRTNVRTDVGTAYDYAAYRAAVVDAQPDLLADGNVVPDLRADVSDAHLDAIADRLADAGPFAHLEQPDVVRPLSVTEFVDDITSSVAERRGTWTGPEFRTPHDEHRYPVVDPDGYPRLGVFTD